MYPEAKYAGHAQAAPRETTELDSIISNLRQSVASSLIALSEIQCRVMPTPPTGEAPNVTPVASTYAEKLREIGIAVESLRETINELGSRI